MSERRVVALVGDLMDRTRLRGAIPELELVSEPTGAAGADVVIVDLVRHHGELTEIRRCVPDAWIVGYGPHVDAEGLARAVEAGADRAIPRSRFFRDPLAAVARPPDQ